MAALTLVFARLRRVAESVLVLALGMLALSLCLHAGAPTLDASAVPVTLLEAPRRTGTTCRAVGWVHTRPPGRALLRLTNDACSFPPGQGFVARLDGAPLPEQRNPGGRSARREWARRGVHLRAAVRAPVVPIRTARTGRARLEGLRRRLGDAVDGRGARSGGGAPGAGDRGSVGRVGRDAARVRSVGHRAPARDLGPARGVGVRVASTGGALQPGTRAGGTGRAGRAHCGDMDRCRRCGCLCRARRSRHALAACSGHGRGCECGAAVRPAPARV